MRRRNILTAAVLCLALLASACGRNPASNGSTDTEQEKETAPETAKEATLPGNYIELPRLTVEAQESEKETIPPQTESSEEPTESDSASETETESTSETEPTEEETQPAAESIPETPPESTEAETPAETEAPPTETASRPESTSAAPTENTSAALTESTETPAVPEETSSETSSEAESETQAEPPSTEETTAGQESGVRAQYLICLDPGHQAQANLEEEPIGPGATQTKPKVSAGTQGVNTGTPEYALVLIIAQQLRAELESRGYRVIMTRTSNDVNISNIERAQIANNAGADAFLRLHCDNSASPDYNGISILCKTQWNPYDTSLYPECYHLASTLLQTMTAATGAKNNGVDQRDDMCGLNWGKVPTVLIEMGFLSNAEDEAKLLDASYQAKLVSGMADGLDRYFGIQD